jgi:hypothetical protein
MGSTMSESDSDDSNKWTKRIKAFVLGSTAVQKLQWAFNEASVFIAEHGDEIWEAVKILLGLCGLALLREKRKQK